MLLQQLSNLIVSRQIDLIIDVGAFKGSFTHKVRKAGFRGPILSVEPNPERQSELRSFGEGQFNWFLSNKAAGVEVRTIQLQVPRDSSFASTLNFSANARSIFGELTADITVYDVEQAPLSSMIEEFGLGGAKRILVKCDTQGTDREVIRSLNNYINSVEVLLVEVPCINIYEKGGGLSNHNLYFESLGFGVAGIYPVSWTAEDAVVEFDILYVRRQLEGS
jgi:FkbM family methyltransferase